MARQKEEEDAYFRFLRAGVHSFIRGDASLVAVEFARRSVQPQLRPSFQESEGVCRGSASDTPQNIAA
jgi:flagellar motor component MotA